MLAHVVALLFAAQPRPNTPQSIVHEAIAALHHADRSAIVSVTLTGIEHTWILGNAERAEGPWRVAYARFSELYDVAGGRLRRTDQSIRPGAATGPDRVTILTDSVLVVLANGAYAGGSHGTFEDYIDRVDGEPERVLQLAAASTELRRESAVTRFGVPHDVVSFPWRNGRMRIEVSRATRLPDAVEIVRPYADNFRWAPFGDVTMRTENVDWQITAAGSYWPMQQKISLNGEPLRDVTYATAVTASAVPSDSFVVADSARRRYASASLQNFSRFRLGMRGQPAELIAGIVRVPDFWSQTLVKQADGVVIFEAHISAAYLHDVIDEARRRWPGAPVKALVMTSDPWAHLGGVREAMALGIPIYAQANSIPFLKRLAAAPHTLAPDSLARSRREPRVVAVSGKTTIGRGDNQIVLYPVGGPYAERMLMAYFPGHKLLYGADLVFMNRSADGQPAAGFLETEATDLVNAVARERLDVDSVFCVQNYGPFAWSSFVQGIRAAIGR
ncbi:MAG TPA: hypothetical protein VN706_18225 [Gemmatimonadaceae bacterium]|nr:hypothetical protein [Gemmatimonadaceae bacterium]